MKTYTLRFQSSALLFFGAALPAFCQNGQAFVPRERFIGTIIALVFVIVAFFLVLYFRHQAAMRLEEAYMDLEEANARAQESSRMKTHFIQQISHEIRTPLNLLAGFTQILTSPDIELDEASRKELKDQITASTGRITNLVNKMLELSEASSQTVIESADSISAMQIAAEAAAVSGISTAAHVDLDVQLTKDAETPFLTNKNAAVRALSLLLDNARKYSDPGRVTLTLKRQSKGLCTLCVENPGPPIAPGDLQNIFKRFYRADSARSRDGSYGLGLPIAEGIVRAHGGRIWAASSGGMNRFYVTVPTVQ